jgi:hypothetical protein
MDVNLLDDSEIIELFLTIELNDNICVFDTNFMNEYIYNKKINNKNYDAISIQTEYDNNIENINE